MAADHETAVTWSPVAYPSMHPDYVLEWVPRRLIPGAQAGRWDLLTADDWDNNRPERDPVGICDAPRDADPRILAEWASALLGQPAALARDDQEIRTRRPFARWHSEPVYYVTAGGQA